MMGGLLIVNADDWGGYAGGTDAIAAAFRAGATTSATAMVHMADSARAAQIAGELGLPLGLHLNLTQRFDGPAVPAGARERQGRLVDHFWPLTRVRRFLPSPQPWVRRAVADAVREQIEAFHDTYGGEPTHIDSHLHVHSAPDVLFQIPAGVRARRTLATHGVLLARRFSTTDEFHGMWGLVPELGGEGLPDAIDRAARRSIEIMVHPSVDRELVILLGDEWRAALASAPLGTYADLPSRQALVIGSRP